MLHGTHKVISRGRSMTLPSRPCVVRDVKHIRVAQCDTVVCASCAQWTRDVYMPANSERLFLYIELDATTP